MFPFFSGEPLRVGMDLTIASFDAISEVNMVSTPTFWEKSFVFLRVQLKRKNNVTLIQDYFILHCW